MTAAALTTGPTINTAEDGDAMGHTPDEDGVYTIPGWFVKMTGICLALLTATFVPWSIWVTVRLFAIQSLPEVISENRERIRAVENDKNALNAQLQVIGATRFTAESGRALTANLEVRFERLENKVDKLQSAVDRSLNGKQE